MFGEGINNNNNDIRYLFWGINVLEYLKCFLCCFRVGFLEVEFL